MAKSNSSTINSFKFIKITMAANILSRIIIKRSKVSISVVALLAISIKRYNIKSVAEIAIKISNIVSTELAENIDFNEFSNFDKKSVTSSIKVPPKIALNVLKAVLPINYRRRKVYLPPFQVPVIKLHKTAIRRFHIIFYFK